MKRLDGPTQFVITGAERTGTNLLIGLINQYNGCYCGGELFNMAQIVKNLLPWKDINENDRPTLIALRQVDPVDFWQKLFQRRRDEGEQAIGFKLLYKHTLQCKPLVDALESDHNTRIVHMVRENQLRRYVSERQARAAGKWSYTYKDELVEMPSVVVSAVDLVKSILDTNQLEREFDKRFASHPCIKVTYENLARAPALVAADVIRFLGLNDAKVQPVTTFRKTGAEDISQVIQNYDELRSQIAQWASFFD